MRLASFIIVKDDPVDHIQQEHSFTGIVLDAGNSLAHVLEGS
jgi:hypothetical protein